MLTTLKNAGMNTVRIRLWHSPAGGRSGYDEVKAFAGKVKQTTQSVAAGAIPTPGPIPGTRKRPKPGRILILTHSATVFINTLPASSKE